MLSGGSLFHFVFLIVMVFLKHCFFYLFDLVCFQLHAYRLPFDVSVLKVILPDVSKERMLKGFNDGHPFVWVEL